MIVICNVLLFSFVLACMAIITSELIKGKISAAEYAMQFSILLIIMKSVGALSFQIRIGLGHYGIAQEALTFITHKTPLISNSQDITDIGSPISIKLRNLGFAYNGKDNLFNKLNITIEENQKVGIVGVTGAGKSTLLGLIQKLYDYQEGDILLNDTSLKDLNIKSISNVVSSIPQDTSLFHRTIKENICYGKPNATDEEVIEAAKKAYAHEFIKNLPQGYDTMVGERGVKLSGGQRQRITIARAIIKDAPILLLDEATSSLDSESEQYIQHSIRNAMDGKTVISVAHRLSTLLDMDRIIVVDNGNIVEDGTHEELLEEAGIYARLWKHQSGGFIAFELE